MICRAIELWQGVWADGIQNCYFLKNFKNTVNNMHE
jgi:hypothetical protein